MKTPRDAVERVAETADRDWTLLADRDEAWMWISSDQQWAISIAKDNPVIAVSPSEAPEEAEAIPFDDADIAATLIALAVRKPNVLFELARKDGAVDGVIADFGEKR